MAEKSKPRPTQQTPQGAEIPVPSVGDVMRDLRKVAKGRPPSDTSAGSAEDEQGKHRGS
jgi:hypothetical protein